MRSRPVLSAIRRAAMIEAVEARRLLAVLDPTFGNGGVANYDDGPAISYSNAHSAVAPDGKIVSIAELDFNDDQISVRRFNADGSVDSTFRVFDGPLLDLGVGGYYTKPTDLLVHEDGSIYIAGEYEDPFASHDVGFVARLHADGTLDTSYGNSHIPGLALLNPTGQIVNEPRLLPGFASVYAAYTLVDLSENNNAAAVTQLDPSGAPVPSFGTGELLGTSITPIHGQAGDLRDIYVDGTGFILVGDTYDVPEPGEFLNKSVFFSRLTTFGGLDADWGNAGTKLTLAPDNTFEIQGTALSPTGLVVAGNAFEFTSDGVAPFPIFLSFDTNQQLDTSFGTGGVVSLPAADGNYLSLESYNGAIAVDANGTIFGTGWATIDAADFQYDVAVFELSADGTFAADGVFKFDQAQVDVGISLTLNAAGGAIVTAINSTPSVAIFQLQPAGPGETPNTAPTVTSVTGPSTVTAGMPVSFTANFSDADLDSLEISWNFGDGTVTPFIAASGNVATIAHTYASAGSYTVTVTVRDPDGATGSGATSIAVTPVLPPAPYTLAAGTLTANGTAGADVIQLTVSGGQAILTYNGTPYMLGSASSVARIIFNGGAGNDLLSVASQITAPATLIGGPGNDTLLGGSGNDVLIGDAGNDSLVGGAGWDLLIGGTGSDILSGSANDDILLGGTTTHSTDLAALNAIQAEWSSNKAWAVRVANVTGLIPLPGRLNGNNFLKPGVTVFNDTSIDTLNGGNGSDLYFLDLFGSDADVVQGNVTLTETLAALLLAL